MLDFGKKYKIQDFQYAVVVDGLPYQREQHQAMWYYRGKLHRESMVSTEAEFVKHLTWIMEFYQVPLRFEYYLKQAELCTDKK